MTSGDAPRRRRTPSVVSVVASPTRGRWPGGRRRARRGRGRPRPCGGPPCGRDAEGVRVRLQQVLPPAQGTRITSVVPILQPHDQAVVHAPRRARLGPLALDLRQRLRVLAHLFRSHVRSLGGCAGVRPDESPIRTMPAAPAIPRAFLATASRSPTTPPMWAAVHRFLVWPAGPWISETTRCSRTLGPLPISATNGRLRPRGSARPRDLEVCQVRRNDNKPACRRSGTWRRDPLSPRPSRPRPPLGEVVRAAPAFAPRGSRSSVAAAQA